MSDVYESKEQVAAAVAAAQKMAKEAQETGAKNREALEGVVKDLRGTLHQMQEAQIAANTPRADGPTSVLRDYVAHAEHDADAIRQSAKAFGDAGEDGSVIRVTRAKMAGGAWEPGLLDDTPRCEWQRDLQEAVSKRNEIRMFLSARGKSAHTPSCDRAIERLFERAPDEIRKAMPADAVRKIFADSSGVGAETIFDNQMPMLDRYLDMSQRVAGLFETVQIDGGTTSNPFLETGLRPYIKGAATVDDPPRYRASTSTLSERTYNPVSMAVRMQVDEEANEDAYIDWLPVGRQLLTDAVVDGIDDAIINGDTASTHQDTIASWDIRGRWGSAGLGTSADHRRMYIGLRARAADVSNTTDQGSTQTAAGMRTARGTLAAPHGIDQLVYLISYEYFLQKAVSFDDFKTLEKYGDRATAIYGNLTGPLPGQVGMIDNIPVCIAWFMGADLNASGVYDNATTTKSGALLVNRSRFKVMVRRGSRIEAAKDITRGVYDQVITHRHLFSTIDASTVKNVHYGYNLL